MSCNDKYPLSKPGSLRKSISPFQENLLTRRVRGKVTFASESKACDSNGVLRRAVTAMNYQACVLFSEMGSIYHFIEKAPLC